MTQELYEALDVMCDMWSQYCGDKWGHMCMSAGENAADILDRYNLLKNDNGYGGEVDYDRLAELKEQIV